MIPFLLLGCPEPSEPMAGEYCVSCHEGIEPIHETLEGQCVVCHGGLPQAATIAAHVPVPDNYWEVRGDDLPSAPEGYIKDFTPNQLDALDPAYLRFINPGDIRVVASTCGTCHPDQAASVPNSIMTTNAGHYMPTLFLAGFQDREARFGSHPAVDADCTGEEGTSCALEPLVPPDDEEIAAAEGDAEATEEVAYRHYLAKSCDTCHAAGYGPNDRAHAYRSSGCSACHVVYGPDGVYEGGDPMIPKNVPVYPKKHELTTAIPTEQCATCHFQGGRIGLLFRGIREGGFSETPEHAVPWAESAYGHAAGYYLLDEDDRNDVDETPPDVHYSAGMHCVDCHVGSDVHGDGRLYATSKLQVDLRCEDCHGSVRDPARADAASLYRTSRGRVLPQLSTGPGGEVLLTGRVDGAVHVVPQVANILSSGSAAAAMVHAMAPDTSDWSHADSLTCDTCHTSYNQFCLGCHVSMDMRLSQIDYQTGHKSTGLVRGSRDTWSLDHVLLGQGPDGRAQSVMPSQQVQMQVFDREGDAVVGTEEQGVFRETEQFSANNGFAPFFQHTTTASPRACATCHRTSSSDEEYARVRGVYGYGTGEFMLEGANGELVDALQFLDADGEPMTAWHHVGTGPLSAEVRDRALAVEVEAR